MDARRALDVPTRAAAALLAHGRRAVITGPTAAWLHGCTAIDSRATHVMVLYGHPSRSRGGLVVHNAPFPSPDDIVELAGLRVFCLERVISDLLCTARPRDAIAVVDQALRLCDGPGQERLRARLAERLTERPDRRGTRRAAQLLDLATGRAESPPESWLLLEVVRLGFPPPAANLPVRSPAGEEVYRLDLAWEGPRIALEYNGHAVHAGREAEDERRAEDLRRRGWLVIFVTSEDLADSRRLERELRAAFARRGCGSWSTGEGTRDMA
ncbi:hypothetical protein BKA01_006120 [Pseudonocardia eucalypti]|uniref:hypothetical protein n=1 Tax=Pseudonocardia eucalypti TaxID=648755 RepID=UPI00160A2FFE|nr:hypothetical protein [Pseudonocardia eucalypti]